MFKLDIRAFVYEIVYSVMENGGRSDESFHRIIEREDIPSEDITRLKREAYGTIEKTVLIDAMIRRFSDRPVKKMDPDVRTLIRIGFYELEFMDSIPYYATCDELPKLTSNTGKKGYINAVLRGFVSELENPIEEDPWKRLAPHEKYSMPKGLWDVLVSAYGKRTTVKMALSFAERAGEVSIHIDPNKISLDEYEKKLDIPFSRGLYVPDTLILSGSPDITTLPGYEDGFFYVQDEGSQLPVLVSGIRPGQTVVDVCGAPGGKSIHALMKLNGTGVVSIRDLSERKLSKIRENVSRMRYLNVDVRMRDATVPDTAWEKKADVLLCDVPCSGYGIIGRKPELKYRAVANVDELVDIQRRIVRASVPMLKPGGVLIYSTCTLHPRENEENAVWIEEELGLKPESLNEYLPESLISRQTFMGRLQVLPGIHRMDGFFVARFVKPA
ncbi:MAG: 16S rRNA (cytosine(967)-C(5))-methyltransferase RsmB [Eubacterium sp.]|nr:16S rRNA (cytosine(967)-C(5))-methyltransferase RsmB [Eubacterium sp.]